jgi:hypothetical protein
VPELSIIFETKVRAPFKVVFEVCKLSEVTQTVKIRQSNASKKSDSGEDSLYKTSFTDDEEDLSAWRIN